MTWLYSLGLGKQTHHHLVHPPTNAWPFLFHLWQIPTISPQDFSGNLGMTGDCLSHEALADFTWGSFIGSHIRGWWWPQRYQVRICGNSMLPYLEKNLCRYVKNLWWDDYPGLCLWARNPVSNLLRKDMLGGPNPRTRRHHVATGKAMLASPDAERDGDGILPRRFWREHSLATTVIPAQKNWVQTSSPQTVTA